MLLQGHILSKNIPKMNVQMIDIDKLIPFDRNPRDNYDAIDPLVKSIETFGFNNPIICGPDMRICAGHTRYKAGKQIGMKTVPVIVLDHLVDETFVGYNIADNQIASIANFDEIELAMLVVELQQTDLDMSSLGFDAEEMNRLMASLDDQNFEPGNEDDQGDLDHNYIKCPNCNEKIKVNAR
jgi:ParB family chromosome partitioning protein